MPNLPREIVICMGSSCFPRGNNRNAEWLMNHIKERGLEGRIQVTGTLCQNQCKQGPNLTVDGECLCGMDPESLALFVEQRLS